MFMSTVLNIINKDDTEKVVIRNTSSGGLRSELNEKNVTCLRMMCKRKVQIVVTHSMLGRMAITTLLLVTCRGMHRIVSSLMSRNLGPSCICLSRLSTKNCQLVPSARDLRALCFMSDALGYRESSTKPIFIERVLCFP